MENKIYFAGLMVNHANGAAPTFEFVSASGSKLPYLTRNKDGLKHTSHHASLYKLSDDFKTATLVDRREGNGPIITKLTVEQQVCFGIAVKNNYFFD